MDYKYRDGYDRDRRDTRPHGGYGRDHDRDYDRKYDRDHDRDYYDRDRGRSQYSPRRDGYDDRYDRDRYDRGRDDRDRRDQRDSFLDKSRGRGFLSPRTGVQYPNEQWFKGGVTGKFEYGVSPNGERLSRDVERLLDEIGDKMKRRQVMDLATLLGPV